MTRIFSILLLSMLTCLASDPRPFTFSDQAFLQAALTSAAPSGWPDNYPTNMDSTYTYAWYTDPSTYYSQGSGLATWKNLSSSVVSASSLDLTNKASGTGKQPTLVTGALNGNAVLLWDGADDYLKNDNWNLVRPFTVAMVIAITNDTGASQTYYAATNSGGVSVTTINGKDLFTAYFGTTITNQYYVRFDEHESATVTTFYTNNISQGSKNSGDKYLGGVTLGSGSALSVRLHGNIAELVAFTNVLSATLRSNLFAYWTNKYAITVP